MSSVRPASRPASSGAFVSVGTKLAVPTVCLLVLVASVVYAGLSRHERHNLLAAKETAAIMVARLYTASLSAPLVFGDDHGSQDVVTNLARDEEVVFSGAWATDALDPKKVGTKVGTLSRNGSELDPPKTIPTGMTSQLTAELVIVESPVEDPSGKVVGVAQVAFSLARENALIRAVERKTMLMSLGIALGVTIVLIALARKTIVRPLGKLVHAAKQLEDGKHAEVALGANDEIGRLAIGFQAMSRAIQHREEEIGARNRDMRLVLDNVEEGFITIDRDAKMSDERSRIIDTWFGAPESGAKFSEYLGQFEPKVARWFEICWESVLEDLMPLELTIEQLPRAFAYNGRSYEFRYRAILDGEALSKMLVVISDVTARIERERAERSQREMIVIFRHMLSARGAFDEFFNEASALVKAITSETSQDITIVRRQVHTLKGNCALYGVDSIAGYCHEVETRAAEVLVLPTVEEREHLAALWKEVSDTVAKLDSGANPSRIELEEGEFNAFVDSLRARADYRALLAMANSWRYEPAERRLSGVADQVSNLARQLQKCNVVVDCKTSNVRLPPRRWAPFWSAFAHVVRNTVDHGLETADEREATGKDAPAHVTLSMLSDVDAVTLAVTDDGRGIDWTKIRHKAAARGLAHDTQQDLIEALFTDSISSRDDATSTSGRGVGLSAVRAAVVEMQGYVEVESALGSGTTFRFVFPKSALSEPSNSIVPSRAGSVRASS